MNHNAIDLRGVRQQDIINRRTERSRGWLQAIEPVSTDPKTGVVWRCRCELCGTGERLVLTRDFRSHRVKKCISCVNPKFRRHQRTVLNVYKRRAERAIERDLGEPFYTEHFLKNWRDALDSFDYWQQFLFEVIMDGRTVGQYRIQAVALVLQCDSIPDELQTFGESRKRKAILRMRRSSSLSK